MKNMPVSELKATLSEQLAKVKAGEEVIVTERGKPIAKIVPFPKEGSALSSHLLELSRTGLIRIGSNKIPKDFWTSPRPTDKQEHALRTLLTERREGR